MPPEQAAEAARLLAGVIVAGREVVARNQTLINDPDRRDPSFSADYFRHQLVSEFERGTGLKPDRIADPEVRRAVGAAIDASVKAVADGQGMINAPGRAFKGFIPALFGRLAGQVLAASTGIVIKQATFVPRSDYNAPDAYERKVLERFRDERPRTGAGERVSNRYRYLFPLYIEASCLQCHGEPKGALDMTGRPMEGYRLGELRGAISVDLPLR